MQKLAELESLSHEQLEQTARRAIAKLACWRLLVGRCLVALESTGAAVAHGCSGSTHYARLLGVPAREISEARCVARRLEELPLLREAAEQGRLPWSSLRRLVGKATPETEARWLELATHVSVHKLERILRCTRKGEPPVVAEDDGAAPEAVETILRLQLTIEEAAVLEQAICLISEEAGRRMPTAEAVLALARHRLGHRVDDLRTEIAVDWETTTAATTEQHGGVTIVRGHRPWWETGRVRYNPAARQATPAQNREIRRRDGYCCSTPGCPHKLWLHTHHVRFYCKGGRTVPWNLVTVCSRCHRNLHRGRVRVSGRAPGRLRWTNRYGRSLDEAWGLDASVEDEDG